MFFLCGHKGLIGTAFASKMESILSWQTCRPIAHSKSANQSKVFGGGADLWMSPTLFRCLQHPFYLSRWPHLSRGKWIHLFSQWAVGAAGLQKIRLWNQLGKEAGWSVLAVPVCCCQAGWKHHRHTRRPSLSKNNILKLRFSHRHTRRPLLSKNILKLRFSFGMTPLLRSLETYLVWHDERRDSLNFNTWLCYCATTGFNLCMHANICKKLTRLVTILSFMSDL